MHISILSMAGLDPAIQPHSPMDARLKAGHGEKENISAR